MIISCGSEEILSLVCITISMQEGFGLKCLKLVPKSGVGFSLRHIGCGLEGHLPVGAVAVHLHLGAGGQGCEGHKCYVHQFLHLLLITQFLHILLPNHPR